MSTTPSDAPAGPPPAEPVDERHDERHDAGPRTSRDDLKDLGRIRRTVGADRKVAGVAGGLARHLDIDPVILRVAFVVLIFFGGSGLLLYGACWLLLPEDGAPTAPLTLDDRSRSIALVAVGGLSALLLLGDTIGQFGFPWPLALIALIALLVLVFLDRDRRPRPTAPPIPHQHDPGTGGFVPAPPGTAPYPYTQPYAQPYAQPYTQPYTQTYAQPGDRYRGYQPPARVTPPRNPRKRGPILFWFTMGLAALGVALLGILDLAGVAVADPAYAAVVVAACGGMLLVGAFYGRAGGLIVIGLVAAMVMGLASLSTRWDGGDIYRNPTSASEVSDHFSTGGGEIILDLTDVTDPAALDGRTLSLVVRAGRIEVILPPGISADVQADVTGGGHIELFGSERGGFNISDEAHIDAGTGAPELSIDAEVFAGEIQIHTEEQ